MEELTRDILDDDFVEIFRWSKYVQYIMGFERADIRDRFVTPPKKGYIIYCFLLWVILVPLSTIYFMFTSKLRKYKVLTITEVNNMPYYYLLVNIVCVVLYYKNHFNKSYLNCKLFVKLQKIDRDLKFDLRMKNKKLSILANFFAVYNATAGVFWVSFMYRVYEINGNHLFTIFVHVTANTYGAEAFIFLYILKYLCVRMEYIVQILKCVHKECKDSEALIPPYLLVSDMFSLC